MSRENPTEAADSAGAPPPPAGACPARPGLPRLPTWDPRTLTALSLLVETSLAAAALLLARFGLYDPRQPLIGLGAVDVPSLLAWTAAGLAAMGALWWLEESAPWESLRRFRAFVDGELGSFFAPLTTAQIAVISAAAGIGEELLFRWALQGGLAAILGGAAGTALAWLAVSLLFGLAHAVTWMYAAIATAMGLILGGLMIASGSVLPAILAHAIFDFAAIQVVVARVRGGEYNERRGEGGLRREVIMAFEGLDGHLLIAVPDLQDPNFVQSVVLLVHHAPQGARV